MGAKNPPVGTVARDGLKFLIVDGDREGADMMRHMIFKGSGQRTGVHVAASIDEALKKLAEQTFDVCFLDYALAESYGFHNEALARLSKILTALVFVADTASKAAALRALNFGGKDFLVKSHMTSFDIAKSIAYALYWKYREIELEATAVRDHVTGLGNVPLFDEHLHHALEVAKRGKEKVGLLMIGLTGMEPVFEDYGDEVSDQLLKQVGERIAGKVRSTDVVARLSDDSFGVVLVKVASPSVVDTITGTLTGVIADKPYNVNGYTLKIGTNIGSSTYPDDADSLDSLKAVAVNTLETKASKQKIKTKDSFVYYRA
ncbi:GGDEF domain-containing protein [Magnetovibrio sp.]|uniref:GGDEF domain-containing protein n=1 Tax=Magnetovibrio sp. TaxID=2024836 RepID=UPI002F928C2E